MRTYAIAATTPLTLYTKIRFWWYHHPPPESYVLYGWPLKCMLLLPFSRKYFCKDHEPKLSKFCFAYVIILNLVSFSLKLSIFQIFLSSAQVVGLFVHYVSSFEYYFLIWYFCSKLAQNKSLD